MRVSPLLLMIASTLACSAPAQDSASRPAPAPTPVAPAPAPAPTPEPEPASPAPAPAAPAPAPTPTSNQPVPELPQLREAPNAFMQALLTGTLIEQSGCLRVSPDGKEPGHLLIWQPGYTARRTGERLEVVDAGGKVVARVGEPLRTGGGEVPLNDHLKKQLKAPVDAACVGPYWVMGELQTP